MTYTELADKQGNAKFLLADLDDFDTRLEELQQAAIAVAKFPAALNAIIAEIISVAGLRANIVKELQTLGFATIDEARNFCSVNATKLYFERSKANG